jgi:outer membrane protein assembly factor BamA
VLSISKTKLLIFLSIGCLLLPACNVLKFVPNGKTLVDANRVKVEGDVKIDNLKEQILLVPNRKMLMLVKFNLWAYYIGNKVFRKDSTRIKNFFVETVGEKPVYLDSAILKRSANNMRLYLTQQGYYEAVVNYKVKTVLKRSYITYFVNPGKPYVIRKVVYNGSDIVLDRMANRFAPSSYLHRGDLVVTEVMEQERDRLTTAFKNSGFYYFNKAFISAKVDTGGHDHGANIYFNIANPGTLRSARPQKIQKVVVEMNFRQLVGRRDTLKFDGIQYLFNGYSIKPNIINRSIKLRRDSLFSQTNLEATYNRLIGLGLFRSVSIRILPSETDTIGKVVVYINLQPSPKYDFIWEPQAITTDKSNLNSNDNNPRNYGFANSLILNNKNVFRNAEDFNIKFRVAAETQFGGGVSVDLKALGIKSNIFGNVESNLTFELLFPKLIGIRKIDLDRRLQNNHTSINLTFLNEINTNFRRLSVPLNLTYQTLYETKDKKQFYIYWSPLQFSLNKAEVNDKFLSGLDPADSLRIVRLFRRYVIPSQKFAIIFNNKISSPNEYWNIRYNVFEISGNVPELYNRLTGSKQKDKHMFGIPYSQFARTDIDAVHYKIYGKNKTLVTRLNIGVGKPYGNSYIMPFERQFFVGGSNSLRAWRPRILGPGFSNSNNTSQIDKTGDMMIVANAEYRFAIIPGLLDGAGFLDAGNIWQITNSAAPETKFEYNTFIKQMALNTGIGLRLNLDFFVLRVDWGIPLHDPTELQGERWVINNFFTKRWIIERTVPLLAVGYPF